MFCYNNFEKVVFSNCINAKEKDAVKVIMDVTAQKSKKGFAKMF